MPPDSASRLLLRTTGLPKSTPDSPSTPYSTMDAPHVPYSNENTRFEVPETSGIRRLWPKIQSASRKALQRHVNWEVEGREPYHEYIHQLVDAGWDNLKGLDDYMSEDWQDRNLVVSVVDITNEFEKRRFADIHDELALRAFLSEESRDGVKVRLYMAEQSGQLGSGVIETFGSVLGLDPRFFQWNLFGHQRILSPAERHRAPYTSIGFTIPKASTPEKGDVEYFRVSIYIQPDEVGDGWTGRSLTRV
jgi:hypothetical protein